MSPNRQKRSITGKEALSLPESLRNKGFGLAVFGNQADAISARTASTGETDHHRLAVDEHAAGRRRATPMPKQGQKEIELAIP